MMSQFALLNLGTRPLPPQRTKVEVVGQNLTNGSNPAKARHGADIGNAIVQQIRGACVDQQFNPEHGTVCAYTLSVALYEERGQL